MQDINWVFWSDKYLSSAPVYIFDHHIAAAKALLETPTDGMCIQSGGLPAVEVDSQAEYADELQILRAIEKSPPAACVIHHFEPCRPLTELADDPISCLYPLDSAWEFLECHFPDLTIRGIYSCFHREKSFIRPRRHYFADGGIASGEFFPASYTIRLFRRRSELVAAMTSR